MNLFSFNIGENKITASGDKPLTGIECIRIGEKMVPGKRFFHSWKLKVESTLNEIDELYLYNEPVNVKVYVDGLNILDLVDVNRIVFDSKSKELCIVYDYFVC